MKWRTVNWCCSRSCCDSATNLDSFYEIMYHATRALQKAELAPRRNEKLVRERHKAFGEAVRAIDGEAAKHERCARKREDYFSEAAQFD